MKQYVVGWDGGGTKTTMEIRDLDGYLICSAQAGSLNYSSQSKDEIRGTVQILIDEMKHVTGSLQNYKSIYISTAGVSLIQAEEFIKEMIRRAGYQNEVVIVGDHEAALYGALGKSEGIVLISGTGSICFGQNKEGKTHRTGGWGHLIDDVGSGYAIGRDILSAAVRSFDGRNQRSILYELVLGAIQGTSINDIIQFTYKTAQSKKDIAALAPLILPAIVQNDKQAMDICKKAANELGSLVIPVAKVLNLDEGEIAFTGGILTHYELIRTRLIDNLKFKMPYLRLVKAKNNSAAGAAFMALANVGIS